MRLTDCHNIDDFRKLAKARLPFPVFDYIDGAAGTGAGEARNRAALRSIQLTPRVLRNVSTRDISTTVFDQHCQVPFGIAPMGMCNLSGPGADLMLARMAAKHQVPHGVSTVASTAMERIIDTFLEFARESAMDELGEVEIRALVQDAVEMAMPDGAVCVCVIVQRDADLALHGEFDRVVDQIAKQNFDLN